MTNSKITQSPVGPLTLNKEGPNLVGLSFSRRPTAPATATEPGFEEIEAQLDEYFAGRRRHFDLPHTATGPEPDRTVWDLVAEIPYGETATYGQLARRVGDGITAQQVGVALARNPLCLVVPCHRVVGADGRLTGYAGGLPRKRWLLDLESRLAGHPSRLF
ncbi:MAG TPA: methylated-DNA--[protein]-cysteine S-methyltransferase [Acidimicrobiales bacterium]|nr:methylated-DNA--[protein]-cysteine S-methyltransferase [Acidimicrobiales bacterium]